MKRFLCLISVFALLLCAASCAGSEDKQNDGPFYEEFPTGDEIFTVILEKNPQATITMSDGSKIVIELSYDSAPNTVSSFIAYANADIYNELVFARAMINYKNENFCINTGLADGIYVAPFYTLGEIENNPITHSRGVITMNPTESGNLSGLFSIMTKDTAYYDGQCAPFGKIIEGMDVVDKIVSMEKDEDGKIVEPLKITSVEIEMFDQEIPDPTIIRND